MKTLNKLLLFGSLTLASLFTPATADEKPVTEKLVDTFTKLAGGPHEGYRANHAEGILATGTFKPSAEAKTISYAPHLQDESTTVIVRFSNATGVPDIDDSSPDSFPKGMSIRFALPEEEYTDIVVISVDRFPVSSPEKFLEFLEAIYSSQESQESPSPLEKFIAENPATKTFVELEKPAPVGFTTQTYYGINAFQFENSDGGTVYGRYIISPVNGNAFLSDDERQAAGPDYLINELPARLANAKAEFTLSVQLAEEGDVITDPTVVWPADRKEVELGTLTLEQVMENGKEYAKANMFNPLAIPEGIAPSNDPVLLARPGAYAISFGRRAGD